MRNCFSSVILCVLMMSASRCILENNEDEDDTLLTTAVAAVAINEAACRSNLTRTQAARSFQTGFESVSEFSGFYLVPTNYQNAASHELQSSVARSGNAHRGFVYARGPNCASWINCNHRAYPTVQLHKRTSGGFRTPVTIEFYVRISEHPAAGEWLSFATFSTDASDAWSRVVLVNLAYIQGRGSAPYLHLMHVPYQGQSNWTYQITDQTNPLAFPTDQFVKIGVCLDAHPDTGFARLYQDDTLVSVAAVRGGCGMLEQAHFGLYASPGNSSGSIYNDDLTIREVTACP